MLWIAPQLQYARDWLLEHWYIYQAALVIVMSALVIAAEANVAAPYKTGVITALTAGGGIELLRDILGREADKRRIAAAHDAADRERRRRTRAERQATQATRRATEAERHIAEAERQAAESERQAAESERRAQQSERENAESERRAAEAERRAQASERENAELRRRLQQQENGAE